MLWGLNGPSYWRDEADTVSAVARSLPQLIRMLGHVDAVHGLYYLLLWPVAQVAGTGETATRLPSALAMAAAAFWVAAIARRLVSRRAALCAGLLFAALPEASMQGHNARPYAMVIAAATASSYLLLRVAEDPRRARVAGYGLSLVLLGYLHMFALLLIPAHAIALAVPGGVRPHHLFLRWLAAAAAACAAVVPLVLLGWAQRGQIGWISRPGWHEASQLVVALTGGAVLASGLIGLLAAGGAVRLGRAGPGGSGARAGGGRRLAWLAVPWLVLPPVVLFAVSAVKPVYYLPYVLFCLPATALLGGAFLAGLSWPARAAAAALAAALIIPTQIAIRVPGSGGSLWPADQILAAGGRPGDAIIYPQGGIPPWDLAYANGFGRLRDIGQAEPGAATGRLYGVSVPRSVLLHRECGVRRIWVAEIGPQWRSLSGYLAPGFRLAGQWEPFGAAMRLWLYQQTGAAGGPDGACCC